MLVHFHVFKYFIFTVKNTVMKSWFTSWNNIYESIFEINQFVINFLFLRGPVDVNIFNESETDENVSSEEIVKESHKIQKEIKELLSQVFILVLFFLLGSINYLGRNIFQLSWKKASRIKKQ